MIHKGIQGVPLYINYENSHRKSSRISYLLFMYVIYHSYAKTLSYLIAQIVPKFAIHSQWDKLLETFQNLYLKIHWDGISYVHSIHTYAVNSVFQNVLVVVFQNVFKMRSYFIHRIPYCFLRKHKNLNKHTKVSYSLLFEFDFFRNI